METIEGTRCTLWAGRLCCFLATAVAACSSDSRGAVSPDRDGQQPVVQGKVEQEEVVQGKTGSAIRAMKKQVTEKANFVLYLPQRWTAVEGVDAGRRTVTVSDPKARVSAQVCYGRSLGPATPRELAKSFLLQASQRCQNLRLEEAWSTDRGDRIRFRGSYEDSKKGKREFLSWIAKNGDEYLRSRIETPAGEMDVEKPLLLTVLSNIRVTSGAFRWQDPSSETVRLVAHRLRDGSASFALPHDWNVRELGTGQFVALDPKQECSFVATSVDFITPAMQVRAPGVPVSPYLPPHRALKFLAESQGIAKDVEFVEVNRNDDLARQMQRVYTLGPVTVDDCFYTCVGLRGRSKGYSMGVTFGTRLGTNWNYRHLTVAAPLDRFDAWVPTFIAMLESYEIDQDWVASYVRRGMERLGKLQTQTMALVARNADEIHRTMQAAYDERQRSMDYIDYQRSNYIRGEQDWISEIEGGTVYHTDSWGTKNTETGESWEGKAFDYVHFEGDNPKYREQMQPVETRALWERRVAPRRDDGGR